MDGWLPCITCRSCRRGKWYIDMSGKLPMRRRAGNAKVRYSAAYPTGAERSVKGVTFRHWSENGHIIREWPY